MSRRFIPVTVSSTAGQALRAGDSVSGTDIDNLVIQNGLVQVLLEAATSADQRGAAHLKRWTGSSYQYALERFYGDYTYFTNTPAARPDRVRIIEASPERCEVAVEWDEYSLIAPHLPNGVPYFDWAMGRNYSQGAVNPDWKYITETRLVKTIIVERGREGYFVGYHTDPRVGPLGSQIPDQNNETAWGERELGLGSNFRVVFSSAGVTRRNPAEGVNTGLGIDDPVSMGGAEQTVGPWWVGGIPDPTGVGAGLCPYIVLRQRLQILDYQSGAQNGVIVVLNVNEAHDAANVPYRTMLFIGAFPYEADADLTNEPTVALRQQVAARAPDDFDESGAADDNGAETMTAASVRDELATAVRNLTGASLAHVPFKPHDNRQDFRTWCNANPNAAFRRFQVRDVGTVSGSEVYDAQQAWHVTEMECVVAYPRDFRYGAQALLDLDDVLWADLNAIDNAIGSSGNATTACVTTLQKDTEEGAGCTFAVLRVQTEFWRETT